MADEALASFQALLSSVPGWIRDLENILTTATSQQAELVAAEQPATTSAKKVRKSSMASLRSKRSKKSTQEQVTPGPTTLLNQQIPHLTGSDFLRLSQRKRKTASVCSRQESQAVKYRSRSMIAIYYDGNAQRHFETLVRAIGSSRNCIRKGKLSMKIDSLSRTGSSSSSCSSEGEETIKGLGTFKYRTTTTLRRPAIGGRDGTEAFDRLDSALEKAQMFCERAAHQILRDGDCNPEVTSVKKHFDEALVIVKAELPSLTKKADKALRRRIEEDEKHGIEVADAGQVLQYSSSSNDSNSFPSDDVLEVDSDEAADDESDGEEFNIMSMKLPPHLSKFTGSTVRPQNAGVTAVR